MYMQISSSDVLALAIRALKRCAKMVSRPGYHESVLFSNFFYRGASKIFWERDVARV
jgi:hypothetical protein